MARDLPQYLAIPYDCGTSGRGAPVVASEGHSEWVDSVSFTQDGLRLASASWDKTVRLWDGKTGAHIATTGGIPNGSVPSHSQRMSQDSPQHIGIKHYSCRDGETGSHIATSKSTPTWSIL